MNLREIALVRATFRSVTYSAHGRRSFTSAFYGNLFGRDANLRQLFPASLEAQRDRFVAAVAYVVENLDDPGQVQKFLEQLARDHRKYGVASPHYRIAADALHAAMRSYTGREFWTDSIDAAWRAAADSIANAMIAGAESDDLPPHWEATVVGHHQVLDDLALVRLQTDAPIPYEAGQYLAVRIPQRPRMWRYLSPSIPPNEYGEIEFHVRAVRGGWVSPSIVNATQPGDRWTIGAPLGGLQVDYESGRDVLMIGSGTGIAPLRAQLLEMAERGGNPRVHLFVGGRYPRDLYEAENMWRLSQDNPWLTVIPVSEERDDPSWHPGEPTPAPLGMHRRLSGRIGHIVTGFGSWTRHQVQIAGSPEMIRATTRTLVAAGVPAANIQCDPL